MASQSYTFKGPGTLQLTPGGREYAPGDTVPLTKAQLRSLKRAKLRFAEADEPKADAAKGDKNP